MLLFSFNNFEVSCDRNYLSLSLFSLTNQVNVSLSASTYFSDTSHSTGLTVRQSFPFVSSLEIKSHGNMLLL